jgi:hypothetical protein
MRSASMDPGLMSLSVDPVCVFVYSPMFLPFAGMIFYPSDGASIAAHSHFPCPQSLRASVIISFNDHSTGNCTSKGEKGEHKRIVSSFRSIRACVFLCLCMTFCVACRQKSSETEGADCFVSLPHRNSSFDYPSV